MSTFLQLLLIGMATGSFYTINALGVVVVFRSSGIINFASGGTAMIGGYMAWDLADQHGWPQLVAIPTAVIASAAVGLLVYVIAIRPLGRASTLTKVIATLAILVSLQQLVILKFGGLPKLPKPFLPQGSVHLGHTITVGKDSLTLLIFTVILTFALWAVYRYTRFGLATSALAESPRSLAGLGWRVEGLRAANWAIAGALAGVTGAGLGPILQLNTGNFTYLLVPTLAAAIIGELRSFPLTLAGGFMVGALQTLTTRYIHYPGSADIAVFTLIFLALVVRGRALPLRDYVHERLPKVGSGEIRIPRLVVGIIAVGTAAALVQQDWVIGATTMVLVAITLLSQVVVTGYAGQLSLAQLTMSGLGGLIGAHLASQHHVPFLGTLVIGMVVMIPIGLIVGLPSLRARGVSLAIATLAFAVAVNSVVLTNSDYTGGIDGLAMKSPSLFGWNFDAITSPLRYFYVCLGLFTVLALGVANLRRGRTGRRMLAVRNNERAAAALGINVALTKLYAFTAAGCIAGAAGIMTVFGQVLPQFTGYDPVSGLSYLVEAVLGGIGFLLGPIIGGAFAPTALPNVIISPWTNHWSWWNSFFPLAVGIGLVVQLIFNPNGLADPANNPFARWRRRQAGNVATSTLPPAPRDDQAATGAPAQHVSPGRPSAPAGRPGRQTPFRIPRPANMQARRHSRAVGELTRAAAVGVAPRNSESTALRAENLRVCFGSVVALDGVSLTVKAGEVLSVIGPNGAGKTTLMDALTGFVRAEGTVELNGTPIHGWAAHRRARAGLARSFQSLELLEDMSVLDNLRCAGDPQDLTSLILDLFRPGRSTVTPGTAAAVYALGLTAHLDKLPTDIGYGERRLVAIARAIAGEPGVILLDEPAAGLSALERTEVARVIQVLAKTWNIAVLLIEHDVELVRRVSDRVIALDFGSPIAEGTSEEVLSHPRVIEAYLGANRESPPATPAAPSPRSTSTHHPKGMPPVRA